MQEILESIACKGECYNVSIYSSKLDIKFCFPHELRKSLYLECHEDFIQSLCKRPVVGYMLETSPLHDKKVVLGDILLSVNDVQVHTPKEANEKIRTSRRPLKLLFYAPKIKLTISEGFHMCKYNTSTAKPPSSSLKWKPKYVVIGGVIAVKPWMMYMYRNKIEYDRAVMETISGKNISVKVKSFSLRDATLLYKDETEIIYYDDYEGSEKGSNGGFEWRYIVIIPNEKTRHKPIKIASPNELLLRAVHEAVQRIINQDDCYYDSTNNNKHFFQRSLKRPDLHNPLHNILPQNHHQNHQQPPPLHHADQQQIEYKRRVSTGSAIPSSNNHPYSANGSDPPSRRNSTHSLESEHQHHQHHQQVMNHSNHSTINTNSNHSNNNNTKHPYNNNNYNDLQDNMHHNYHNEKSEDDYHHYSDDHDNNHHYSNPYNEYKEEEGNNDAAYDNNLARSTGIDQFDVTATNDNTNTTNDNHASGYSMNYKSKTNEENNNNNNNNLEYSFKNAKGERVRSNKGTTNGRVRRNPKSAATITSASTKSTSASTEFTTKSRNNSRKNAMDSNNIDQLMMMNSNANNNNNSNTFNRSISANSTNSGAYKPKLSFLPKSRRSSFTDSNNDNYYASGKNNSLPSTISDNNGMNASNGNKSNNSNTKLSITNTDRDSKKLFRRRRSCN